MMNISDKDGPLSTLRWMLKSKKTEPTLIQRWDVCMYLLHVSYTNGHTRVTWPNIDNFLTLKNCFCESYMSKMWTSPGNGLYHSITLHYSQIIFPLAVCVRCAMLDIINFLLFHFILIKFRYFSTWCSLVMLWSWEFLLFLSCKRKRKKREKNRKLHHSFFRFALQITIYWICFFLQVQKRILSISLILQWSKIESKTQAGNIWCNR